jgi:hypothetical protein
MKSRRRTHSGKGGEGFYLRDLKEAGENTSVADALVQEGRDISRSKSEWRSALISIKFSKSVFRSWSCVNWPRPRRTGRMIAPAFMSKIEEEEGNHSNRVLQEGRCCCLGRVGNSRTPVFRRVAGAIRPDMASTIHLVWPSGTKSCVGEFIRRLYR